MTQNPGQPAATQSPDSAPLTPPAAGPGAPASIPARHSRKPALVALGALGLVAVILAGVLVIAFRGATHAYAGTFSPTGSMGTPRNDLTATLLSDGRVLIAGGLDARDASMASAEIYDPKTDTFSPTGSMRAARFGQTATLLSDGRVLIAGGDDNSGRDLASAELYS